MKSLNSWICFLITILFVASCASDDDVVITPPVIDDPVVVDDPDPDPDPDSTTVSDVIKWENWYLSVPIDAGGGKATSIFSDEIVNGELTTEESQYFYENDDGSYTFWTKFTGFTTSGLSALGDKYCRTELREFWRGNIDGSDNWPMTTGIHILESTIQVNYVEGNGRTIVAQIHGKESPGISGNPATVKIRWNSGMIQIDHYTVPDAGEPWTSAFDKKIDFGRVDNEVFTFKMKVEGGKLFCGLVCEAKDLDIEYTEIYDYAGNGYVHENYFKTGNYFAWNDDYEKAAEVILHKVITDHQ